MAANQKPIKTQVEVLGWLRRNPLTASSVADRTAHTHGAIRHRMRRLEDRGFVRRAATQPMIVWELTAKGRSAIDEYYS